MDYTKFLRWALLIGLCAVPFIAFVIADGAHTTNIYIPFVNMFFPYITGKNFIFRILVEVLLALYVLLAIREPKYRPRSSLLMWALAAFVLWMALATATSVDPIKSFWSNFERMDGYITLIHMFAFFIIAGAMLTAENWWNKFFKVSVTASALMSIGSLFQAFHLFGFAPSSQSGPRADGTFGNAIYLAVFMLFNIFITLYLLQKERKSPTAWAVYGIAFFLQFATLYYTETRGALLGVLGGMVIAAIYVAIFAKGAQWRNYRRWSMYAIGALAVLVILFLAVRNTSFVQHSNTLQRFASISLTDRTTQARFTIWGEALQGVKEKPVLGWGQENFNFVFNKFYQPSMYDQEQWFDRAHNAFLDWATAGGIPALLLYVSLFALAAWAFFRSDLEVPEQALFVGLLAGYAFNNLTVFDNLFSYIYFYLILAFAHSLSRKKLSSWMFMSKPLDDRTVAVAAPIALVVLIFGIYQLNWIPMARAQTLIDALTPVNQTTGAAKDPKENLASFQTALGDGPLGYQETVEQLFQFASNNVAPSSSVSPDVKQQAFTQTQAAGDALLKMRPGDARLELFYGVFLDQFGQYQAAMAHLQASLKDSPNKQQILFEIASTYLAAGDSKDAIAPAEQAFNEEPAYPDARVLYAAALYYNGQYQAADQLLVQGFGSVLYDNQQLLQTYFATKQYGRLAQIYAAREAASPNDAQSMIAHAVTSYLVNGNASAAIAELKKASSVDPAAATEAQSFIDQINAGTLKP
ncbi:MAG: O-antigen ligase family protein [Patescibacteria group bacterium]|nr:O-antigen ligase family protein [Patescibacteria group bacterium]